MRDFDVQSIELGVPSARAFDYIADPANLPDWTNAFAEISGSSAVMRTPDGEVTVDLEVRAAASEGTIDWMMTFPDGSVATVFSRLAPIAVDRTAYTFVLTAPPVPLEQLEGALAEQSAVLSEELERLQSILAS